jgi:hypothetical protein
MKGPRGLVLGIGLALGLAGCATMPNTSVVTATNSPSDDQVIATAVSSYLGTALPPGRTTLIIEPVQYGSSPLLDQLGADLRARGFGVTDPKAGATGDTVRVIVGSAFGGYVVSLDFNGQEAGTYFGRDVTGALQPSTPFVVREPAQ